MGFLGFAAGVFTGTIALKHGFSLGRAHETGKINGAVLPVVLVVLFVLSLTTTLFAAVALLFGAIAQKCRTCFAGSIRDVILMRNFDLITVIGGLFAVMLVFNLATGGFKLSFAGQPVAHSQHIWNILGLYAVGFAAVLAGGCPLRQLVLAGQGSSDSAVTFLLQLPRIRPQLRAVWPWPVKPRSLDALLFCLLSDLCQSSRKGNRR